MYQALYRKWRPTTFDEVSGQSHITDTLKTQVATDRLSHAYLFTGTRGTGKTSCAKILARAINCEQPVDGNPCNQCPACLGIMDGSILDVVELDAASNNGVEQIRALRDEASFAPVKVKKRVYIVDEVHMLSTSAFNALLKILEEPPEYLVFILATTELHKVLPTILSRCQRFSFKRILPEDLVDRLLFVSGKENIRLTPEGAALIARLADGGMRDALSLLDQCATAGGEIDRERVLDSLGLAGNLKTAHIFNAIRKGDAATAITLFGELYAAGKDVSSVLSELTSLSRDLLIRQTAPGAAMSLLVGGYDDQTLDMLTKNMPPERLIAMLRLLEEAMDNCKRSGSSRTIAEICMIRLCDPSLDGSNLGLAARIAKLETAVARGVAVIPQQAQNGTGYEMPPPPGDDEVPPYGDEDDPGPRESADEPKPIEIDQNWRKLLTAMNGRVLPIAYSWLKNTENVVGQINGSVLNLFFMNDLAYDVCNAPDIIASISDVATGVIGRPIQVAMKKGSANTQAGGHGKGVSSPGSMSDLKAFIQEHSNN